MEAKTVLMYLKNVADTSLIFSRCIKERRLMSSSRKNSKKNEARKVTGTSCRKLVSHVYEDSQKGTTDPVAQGAPEPIASIGHYAILQ